MYLEHIQNNNNNASIKHIQTTQTKQTLNTHGEKHSQLWPNQKQMHASRHTLRAPIKHRTTHRDNTKYASRRTQKQTIYQMRNTRTPFIETRTIYNKHIENKTETMNALNTYDTCGENTKQGTHWGKQEQIEINTI